jgi:hypothetical protein
MNRINELMIECGLWIDYDNREVTRRELEFFAEQIVRECVTALTEMHSWQTLNNQNYPHLWHHAIDSAVEHLKESFGVEP